MYAYELRGQGNDPDEAQRGDIGSGSQWTQDLQAFTRLVRGRHPGDPIVWYGESLGTLIALSAAHGTAAGANADAIVLATPIAGLKMPVSMAQRCLLLGTSHLLPNIRLKLGDLAGVDETKMRVTTATTHGTQMEKTPHHVSAFSLRLLREVDRLIDGTGTSAPALRMPVLVLASPNDVVSSQQQVQALFVRLGSRDKTLAWYPKSYHLLLHDVQREEVLGNLLTWLRHQLKQKAHS